MICIGCDCSDLNPCIDEVTGQACAWVPCAEGPLCSFCAEIAAAMVDAPEDDEPLDAEPLVTLASEAQCDAFLRARRAGA